MSVKLLKWWRGEVVMPDIHLTSNEELAERDRRREELSILVNRIDEELASLRKRDDDEPSPDSV